MYNKLSEIIRQIIMHLIIMNGYRSIAKSCTKIIKEAKKQHFCRLIAKSKAQDRKIISN
jgi:hypothetical protein